jgi:hypothetical protein
MSKTKKVPASSNTNDLSEQAMLIAGEIFNLINQYTHDSIVSKFFLTDEVARSCYGLAGGFASVIYTPALEPEDVKDTTILSFIYAVMTYGFNIYLRERSFITNGAPYTIPSDSAVIKAAQRKTLRLTSKGSLSSTPLADKIITILVENVRNQIDLDEMKIAKHRLNKKKFMDYTKLSLYWGYNFAKALLAEEKTKNVK